MKELIEKAIQINEELVAKLKELEELEEPNLLGADGKYFTCEIEDIKTKGRIRVEDIGVYLCQDEADGLECKEKYGYNYSYFIRKGTETYLELVGITNLKLWDYLPKEGEYFYVKTKLDYAFIAIAKNGEDLTNKFVSLDQDNGRLNYDESGFVCLELDIKELRSATTEEITLLDTKLKENGQYFDQESMSIKDIVNEPAFKVGDWFIPKKPEDFYSRAVYWDFEMDKFSGKKLKIEAITTSGMLLSNDWKFHPDWCAKVEVSKPNKPKVGDLCIFWDEDKSNAVIGKLTEIDNKSDFPYEVANSIGYKNCIKFESMEQYNKFIAE